MNFWRSCWSTIFFLRTTGIFKSHLSLDLMVVVKWFTRSSHGQEVLGSNLAATNHPKQEHSNQSFWSIRRLCTRKKNWMGENRSLVIPGIETGKSMFCWLRPAAVPFCMHQFWFNHWSVAAMSKDFTGKGEHLWTSVAAGMGPAKYLLCHYLAQHCSLHHVKSGISGRASLRGTTNTNRNQKQFFKQSEPSFYFPGLELVASWFVVYFSNTLTRRSFECVQF